MREIVPLRGQTTDAAGDAVGDRDPLVNGYGSARLDYYADNGAVLTLDGGASQVQNEIFVTGIGRVQVAKAIKPYIRAAVAHDRYNVFGYWHSRTSLEPQFSLQSGLPIEERSDIFHVEGQTNWNFLQDRGRVVDRRLGRNTRVNTSGTLMNLANDDRSDNLYSVYGQVEYKLVPQLRVVGALRWDDGDLIDRQFSPKGALVYSPNENHSFRFSVNRAFQTPNYSEFFLQVPVAAPSSSPATLEGGIEQYYAAVKASLPAPALAGLTITDDLPWNFSAQTPALALGNRRSQGREGDRLGAGLQRQPDREGLRHGRRLHQRAQGLRHRPAAGREPRIPQLRARRRGRRAGRADGAGPADSGPRGPGGDHPAAGRPAPRARSPCCSAGTPSCRRAHGSRAPTRWRPCRTGAGRSCSRTPTPAA